MAYKNMKKKKTDTCDLSSDLLTSLWSGKLRLYLIFFMIFHQLYPTQHKTYTRAQKDFLLPLLAQTENLNRNMHPHTRKHWSAGKKPRKLHTAHPTAAQRHNLCLLTNTLKIEHTLGGLSAKPPGKKNCEN